MKKSPFSREGETLLPVPLDPSKGGRAPMTSTGMAVDMGAAGDKTAEMFQEAHSDPNAYDNRGYDFEREYAARHGVTPEKMAKAAKVVMPEIEHARNQKSPKLIVGTTNGRSKMVRGQKLIGGTVDQTPIVEMMCPKCNATTPGDWSQCRGTCPISFSPHYLK